MTYFQALFLGIVQGLTEFLPVSSSGHLELIQILFGLENLEQYLFFTIVCHMGTLLAILIVFYKEIANITKKQLIQIAIGTLPLFPLTLFFKEIKAFFNAPAYLGTFFMITSLLLFLAVRFGWEKSERERRRFCFLDPLVIGLFQALALFPGISRSGSTISGARLLGWPPSQAVSFSFLLAIPAICGSMALEGLHIITEGAAAKLALGHYFLGFSASFLVGWQALVLLIRLASKNKFMYFVWYCLLLGLWTHFFFNYG